jgi:hypothetical protein
MRDELKEDIRLIKSKDSYLGDANLQEIRNLSQQKQELEEAVKKRKDASLDMLNFLNEKVFSGSKEKSQKDLLGAAEVEAEGSSEEGEAEQAMTSS